MSKRLKVLIVEDEQSDIELMLHELHRAGFVPDATSVATETEFCQALTQEFDVILSDYSLPQMDAMQALKILKDRDLDVPIVIVTGSAGEELAVECMKQGAADYLLKDRLTRLGQAVTQALERKRLREEKRRAEIALQKSEERFRMVSQLTSDYAFAFRVEPDGTVVNEWVTGGLERITGFSRKELAAKGGWQNLIHPEDLEIPLSQLQELLAGKSGVVEFRIIRKDGQVRWMRDYATPEWDEQGKRVVAIFGAVQDITEQKIAEEELKKSENFLAHVLSSIQDGISVLDPDLTIRTVNRVMEQWYADNLPLVGKKCYECYHNTSQPCEPCPTLRCLQSGKTEMNVVPGLPGSRVKWLELYSYPMRETTSGEITGVVEFVRNVTDRVEAEAELARLASVVKQASENIIITDLDGNIIYANPIFEKNSGYSVGEALGENPRFLKSGRHDQAFYENLWQTITAGKTWNGVFINRRKDGSLYHEEATIFPVKDRNGKVINYAAVKRDISDRIAAENALRESEESYRTIFHNTGTAMVIIEEDTTISLVNEGFEKLSGYRREEIEGKKSWTEFVFPADLERMKQHHFRRRKNPEAVPRQYEFRFQNKEGEPRDVFLTISMIPGTGKSVASLNDVTDLKAKDRALRESEEKYRKLIEHSNDAIYLLYNRKFEIINARFQEMFGVTLEEVNKPGFDFIQLVAPKSRPFIEERAKRAARGEKLKPNYEFTAIGKNGEEIEVEAAVSYIQYKDGVATQGILRDITERKRLEAQLLQAQKMEAVGRLAGGVAHDFNNLLTVITGYSQMILNELSVTDPIYRDIHEINSAAHRATQLTQQLLAFSRKQMLQMKVLNLNRIITNLEKMLRRVIGEDIILKTFLDPDLGTVKADVNQIEQVIMNLAVNARDAMPGGGDLTIETKNVVLDETYVKEHYGGAPGPFVMISISDTGEGMDEETRKNIFEPFFTTKEMGKGTGLGLSTVYGIVKQMGGYIWVYSEPDQGTTFKIYLPRVEQPADNFEQREIEALSQEGTETILLVEDEKMVRHFATNALNRMGYKVLTASNAEEALKISKKHPGTIDLVISDVVMPRMSGPKLVEKVKLQRPHIKVLFISGYADESIVHHGILEEGFQFLQKPFPPARLLKKVREILG